MYYDPGKVLDLSLPGAKTLRRWWNIFFQGMQFMLFGDPSLRLPGLPSHPD
jgi:hypothetical protein